MNKEARKKLIDDYKQKKPRAGVYKIINTQTERFAVCCSLNLDSIKNRYAFAIRLGDADMLGHSLKKEFGRGGLGVLEIQELDVMEIDGDMSQRRIRDDLEALRELWQEKLGWEMQFEV